MKLSPVQRRAVLDNLDKIFYNLKARLLGRFFTGPRIYFEVVQRANPMETIEGLFQYTMKMLYGAAQEAPEEQLEALAETTGNYLDVQRLKISNKVLADIAAADNPKDALDKITENVNKISEHMDTLVASEARHVQAYAEREGITRLGASIGVEDPVVYKIRTPGKVMCPNCRKLWHTPENLSIPKVYKLSELQEGYMTDHKNPYPTIGHTHPHCRHDLSMLPPNYGFNSAGIAEFRNFGYDEYEHQRKS
jgi:hypothetical protein